MRIRFLTAGESHGRALLVILEGLPAGLPLSRADIDRQLARRQRGFGRGGRMAIEKDRVQIIAGVRKGFTLGSPLGLLIENRDWPNWEEVMAVEPGELPVSVTLPRPGHADLAGALKFGWRDIRNVLERASARETAARVAAGAVARKLLAVFGIKTYSRVVSIGTVVDETPFFPPAGAAVIEKSPVRCLAPKVAAEMMALIRQTQEEGDTLGGIFEVVTVGFPVGLGSYTQWDLRLDGRLAAGLMSIPAVKAVEIGSGFANAHRFGSEVHDEIFYNSRKGFYRRTNRAGGLEGGVTNGQPLVLRGAMKPIATLKKALRSVDLVTKKAAAAHKERSDVCAVPAAGVVAEAMVSLVLADAFLEKLGGDSLLELKRRYAQHQKVGESFR